MSLFSCPLCGSPLHQLEKTYLCPSGHSFDRAREGYVHLLPANRIHSKAPGDDAAMVAGRARFLAQGHYAPLCDALCALALASTDHAPAVLDSGCGEGYYTQRICHALFSANRAPRIAGIDLSKPALRKAALCAPLCEFAAASAYHLPLADASIDLLVNCFSPLAADEFLRVLKPGGVFLYVIPATRHLFQLKEILYDRPYENQPTDVLYPGFIPLEVCPVTTRMHLEGAALQDLFQMTPYFWKTPKSGADRLATCDALDVDADFRIHSFKKI